MGWAAGSASLGSYDSGPQDESFLSAAPLVHILAWPWRGLFSRSDDQQLSLLYTTGGTDREDGIT